MSARLFCCCMISFKSILELLDASCNEIGLPLENFHSLLGWRGADGRTSLQNEGPSFIPGRSLSSMRNYLRLYVHV